MEETIYLGISNPFWGSIFDSVFFLLYIHDLPDDVTCNIAIYADDTFLYSKYNHASDLWQHSFLPLKFGGGSFLKFGQKGRYEKIAQKYEGSSVFLKHIHYYWNTFLSGKYSHLIDLFIHVVYFLLENDILWNLFSFSSYF